MQNYSEYPLQFGVNMVTELNADHYYLIPKSQTLIFPFQLDAYAAVEVDAGHTSFYNNQAGTISAWASNEINGRSITGIENANLSRISLQAEGFKWLFYKLDTDLQSFPTAYIKQWVLPNQSYFMCFQNLENKENGLYVRFTYLTE